MKFPLLAVIAATCAAPAAAEMYFKEQFNDEVRWKDGDEDFCVPFSRHWTLNQQASNPTQ